MKQTFLLITATIFLLNAAQAQRRGNRSDTSIRNTTLDVYQVYKPELKPYVRPELQPSLPPAPPQQPEPVYNVPQQTLYFSYRALPLRPLALGKDTTPVLRQNYVKLGGGNLSTFTGEAGIGNLHGKDWKAALLAHLDSRGGNIQAQKYLHAGIVADGDYSTAGYNYSAGIEADYQRYYLYGYDHDSYHYSDDDLARPYTFLSAHAALQNRQEGPLGISYSPWVKASVLFAKPISAERDIEVSLPFTKKIDTALSLSLSFDGAFAQLSSNAGSYPSDNVFSIRPAATIASGALTAHLGISPAFGRGCTYLLPQVSARYRLDQPIAFSAGWEADLIQNTYRQLSLKNPFLQTPANPVQTRQDEAYLGAEAGIGAHLSLYARGSYWHWDGLPQFINAAPDGKEFSVIFDPKAVALSLKAGAKYQFAETVILTADGAWYAYLNPTFGHIYGEPSVRLRADLSWHLLRNLSLHAYTTWLDGIEARNASGESVKLKPTLDVGGGAEYSLLRRLSLFADVANLLNNPNERWLGYQSFGINIWGGLRVKF